MNNKYLSLWIYRSLRLRLRLTTRLLISCCYCYDGRNGLLLCLLHLVHIIEPVQAALVRDLESS